MTLSGARLPAISVEETFEAGRALEARYDVTLAPPPRPPGESDDLEIVVTAPPLRRQAVSTEVSATQAKKLPGTQGDVLRVVENLPGVARPSAGSGRLVVWGAAPEDTRVYVDGVPIPRLYHDGGLRSVLPSEIVGAVELVPGGYGAEYGRGLGGLVTVTTRSIDEPGVHGALGLDVYDASAFVRARLGKRVHLALGLRRSHLDSVLSVVENRVAEVFPIPRYWDAQARLRIAVAPRQTLDLTALFSLDELTRGRQLLDPLLVASETRGVSFTRVSLRWRHERIAGGVATVTPFGGFDRNRLALDVGGVRASVESETALAGLRASWRGRLAGWLTLEAGLDVDVRRTTLARTGALALPPREGDIRVFGQPPPDKLGADRWDTLFIGAAPYVEADFSVARGKLHVVPGLRVDPQVRLISRKTPPVGETPQIGLAANDVRAEPRLTIRYQPIARLGLKAAVGLYHQQPAAEDLSAVFGSPTLPVAQAVRVLAGFSVNATRVLGIEATGFYSEADRLAVRAPTPAPALAQALVATGQGRAYGAQLLVRLEPWHGLFGWVSYTVMRSERRADATSPWRAFDYDQTHLFTAVAAWLLPRGFEVGLRLRVASGYPRTAVVSAAYDATTDLYQPAFGAQNGDRIPLFVQLDARASKRFTLGKTELEISLDIQNVTNQGNPEEIVYNHDYSQRGYITGLPILPVLGVKWTF